MGSSTIVDVTGNVFPSCFGAKIPGDLGLFSQEVSLRGWGFSIKPPPRWKVGLWTVALQGDLGLFALELPQIGKKGEHGPEGILGGFAALTVCVGLAILHVN